MPDPDQPSEAGAIAEAADRPGPVAGDGRRPPPLARLLRAVYRSLPGVVIGLLLGVAGTLVWQVFVVDSERDAFAPAPQPRDPDVVVTLSYALIAALINEEIARSEISLPLRDIRAGDDDGRLVLRGSVRVLGRDVPGSVELEPHVEDGRLVTRLRGARLGGLPIPSNVQRLAEDPLNRQLLAVIGNLPATLSSVRVSDAGLVVTADVRIEELPFFQEQR